MKLFQSIRNNISLKVLRQIGSLPKGALAFVGLLICAQIAHSQCEEFKVEAKPATFSGGFLLSCTSGDEYIEYSNVSCAGAADGRIDLNITGGITPYGYFWSNGASSKNIEDLTAGLYSVRVVDATGCISTWSGELTEPEPVKAKVIVTSSSYSKLAGHCQVLDAKASSGGSRLFFYEWSDGMKEPVREFCSGQDESIVLTLRDLNGCSDKVEVLSNYTESLSETVDLFQAYPNPFADHTQLRIRLTNDNEIRLELFAADGKKVATIWEGDVAANEDKEIDLKGANYSQGVYEVRMSTREGARYQVKLMLVR